MLKIMLGFENWGVNLEANYESKIEQFNNFTKMF